VRDMARTFDGTLRGVRGGVRRTWSMTTTPTPEAEAAELLRILEGTGAPIPMDGYSVADLAPEPGEDNCPYGYARATSVAPVESGGERRYAVSFSLEEVSPR
jgi:hypothetical protein